MTPTIDKRPPNDPNRNWTDRDYLVAIWLQTKAVGIAVTPGVPTGDDEMKVMLLRTSKKTGPKTAVPIKPKAAPVSFQFLDDQDDLCTVQGIDAAGNPVDISAVATLAVSSDTPAVCSADAPSGMSFQIHGLTPGTANIITTATWTDSSVGPFSFNLPVTVTGDAATGIVVTPGTPTVR